MTEHIINIRIISRRLIIPQESEIKRGDPELKKVLDELDKIPNEKTLVKAEELHKNLTFMSVKDKYKEFTI